MSDLEKELEELTALFELFVDGAQGVLDRIEALEKKVEAISLVLGYSAARMFAP